MEYQVSDSSGINDDVTPSYQNIVPGGGYVSGNGISVVGSAPYLRMQSEMEAQIHKLEQEAYCAVLCAFKAQSDAITWVFTLLHSHVYLVSSLRELLSKVNADDIIRRIRNWRRSGGNQAARLNATRPVHDLLPSPGVAASRKKQKTSQLVQSLPGISSAKSMHYPPGLPAGNRQFSNHGSLSANEPADAATIHPLVGRKVQTRWPEDNNFYEAVITDYNHADGWHALVYDINTPNETWEWVDLKEIPPEDIRWDGEVPSISYRGRGVKKQSSHIAPALGAGREQGSANGQFRKEYMPSQYGVSKKASEDIELHDTETLVKEKVFDASHLDPLELEKARKKLKEHELALIDALARLADASDGETDGEQPSLHAQ
ncbi:hypothetical protein SLA2020_185920 [Shorea laevis]